MSSEERKVAIVGAGLAGLTCARALVEAGVAVALFDKARGAGGRLTTRRRDLLRFDHGAQFFTTRDERFRVAVEAWHSAGVVAPWNGRFAHWSAGEFEAFEPHSPRWVGAPRMSMIGRHLARDLDVSLSHRVTALVRQAGGWMLAFDAQPAAGPFAAVVLACPGPQAAALLPEESRTWTTAEGLRYAPCWAAMLDFEAPVPIPYDGIHFDDGVLQWAARDSSKPGRASGERWVVHASPSWSEAALEVENETALASIVDRFETLAEARPRMAMIHRWRYALAVGGEGDLAVFDPAHGLGVCGDALAAPRVEGAFVSGLEMSARLLESRSAWGAD